VESSGRYLAVTLPAICLMFAHGLLTRSGLLASKCE
jgi:hypothetical protein